MVAKNDEGKEVVLFRPTQPYLVKKEMDDILTWTNATLLKGTPHPLLVIANFIFEFLAIHPFHDGNGRLSRALTNLLLLKSGYAYIPYVSLEEIIENRKAEYYLSLRETQKHHKTENEDIGAWTVFLLSTLLTQAEEARHLIERSDPEQILSGKQLVVLRLFDEHKEITPKLAHELLGRSVPLVTIKQALARLVVLKLVKRIGLGRATRYRKL